MSRQFHHYHIANGIYWFPCSCRMQTTSILNGQCVTVFSRIEHSSYKLLSKKIYLTKTNSIDQIEVVQEELVHNMTQICFNVKKYKKIFEIY